MRRTPPATLALALAASVVAAACDSSTGGHAPRPLRVLPEVYTVVEGGSRRLAPRIVTASGDTVAARSARWTSSNPAVAEVSADGVLRGHHVGSTRVRVALGSDTGSVGITVTRRITSLALPPLPDSIFLAGTVRPLVTALDAHGNAVSDASLAWSSSDTTIATVDSTGLVRGVGWGSATIRVSAHGKRSERTLKVRYKQLRPDLRWLTVTARYGRACGLTDASEAYCWGGITSSTPIPTAVPGGLRYTRLSISAQHACGLEGTGRMMCWGSNFNGPLGQGAPATSSADPIPPAAPFLWKAVAAGGHAGSCGVRADDDVLYCWGHNDLNQLGRPPGNNNRYDVAPAFGGLAARAVVMDHFTTCALAATGEVQCAGQLADVVARGAGVPTGTNRGNPATLASAPPFVSFSASDYVGCGLTSAGAAYCFGTNVHGAVGVGDSSITNPATPLPVAGGLHFTALEVASHFGESVCALAADGRAYCWGFNLGRFGYLGAAFSGVPVAAGGPYRFRAYSPNESNSACGVTVTGELFCWGAGYEK